MSSKLLSQKAFSGSIHHYLTAFFVTFFGFLTSIYIIKKLTVDEFGVYHFLLSIILLAQVVTSLGLPQIIQRYLPEYREKGNSYFQKRILLMATLIRFLAGFIFVSILLIVNDWTISIFNLPQFSRNLFPLIALIVLLVLESQLLGDAALVALFENRYWSFSKVAYGALKFALFFLALSMGYGITGIVLSWLVTECVLFSLFLVKAHKLVFSLSTKKEDIQPLPVRRFINFGRLLFLSQANYFFTAGATDIFILSYFLGTYAVGLYSFALGIPLMLMSFSPGSRLRAVTTPFLVERYTKTDSREDLSYFFQLINKIIFFTMIPVLIILIILADKVIMYIFSPKYLEVTNLFMLSLGFVMIRQFAYAYTSIILTLEKTKIIFVGSLTGIYNLIMDLVLIPRLGIVGAILATGSAGIMLPICYHFAVRREKVIKLSYPWNSFMKSSFNIVITALIIFYMKDFIHSLASLITVLTTAGLIYLVSSYFNKSFGDEDRQILNQAIGRRIWVF